MRIMGVETKKGSRLARMSTYFTVYEVANNWGVSPQHVCLLCRTNKVVGAKKTNGKWTIPMKATKPEDGRKNNGKHMQNDRFRYLDLFAGIGGFHQGIDRVAAKYGFDAECVFSADNDPFAARVYEKNYGKKCHFDLKDDNTHRLIDEAIGSDELTCVFGGFPCQPFSKAGNREGFADQMKGTLFFEIEKIIHRHKPKYVLLENVRNLKNHDGGHTWNVIKESLEKEGYVVDDVIISPNNIASIPALRERFFILAYNRKKLGNVCDVEKIEKKYNIRKTSIYPWSKKERGLTKQYFKKGSPKDLEPINEKTIDMWDDLLQMLREKNRSIITPLWPHYFDKSIDLTGTPEWKKRIIERNQEFYENNKDVYDAWYKKHKKHFDSLCRSDQKFEWNAGDDLQSVWEGIIQFRPSGVRVKRPDFIPTLVTMNQTPILGCEKRYIKPEEVAKIYGFERLRFGNQSDSECRKQLGNTVSVDVVEYLIQHMLSVTGWR